MGERRAEIRGVYVTLVGDNDKFVYCLMIKSLETHHIIHLPQLML